MNTKKTLADAKHGGCVQLGDGRSLAEHITDHLCHHEYDIGGRAELLACVVEAIASDARDRFEAWARRNGYTLTRAADGEYCFISTRNLWNEYQAALSAQPSPGGKGDALEALVADWKARPGITDAYRICAEELGAALAARQPVGEPVAKSVGMDALEQILLDPENQPSQFGTVPTELLEKCEEMISDLVHQFGDRGCTCTFPEADCCAYARAEHYSRDGAAHG